MIGEQRARIELRVRVEAGPGTSVFRSEFTARRAVEPLVLLFDDGQARPARLFQPLGCVGGVWLAGATPAS